MRQARNILLALLAGILMPIIIWVCLFVAVKEQVREWRLRRMPARTIEEILTIAGLTIQNNDRTEETPVADTFLSLRMPELRALMSRVGL